MAQATLSSRSAANGVSPDAVSLLPGELVPQSAFPQAVFNTDASIRAWNKHVESLTNEEREKFLQNSTRSVHEYSTFVEDTCKKYEQQSRSVKINKLLRPFFKTLNLYLPTLANAAQADPYPSSVVIGGIMCILQISEGFIRFQEQLSEWLENLSQKISLLMEYDICIYQYDERVQDALVLVYGDVLIFCQKAYRLFFEIEKKTSLRMIRKALKETFSDTFSEVITSFNAHLQAYENIAKLCDAQRLMGLYQTVGQMAQVGVQTLQEQRRSYQELLQATKDMAEMTRQLRQDANENARIQSQRYGNIASALAEVKEESRAQEQRQRLEAYRARRAEKKTAVLEWLPSVEDDHDRRLQKLMPGTGQWLLEHDNYKSWKESSTSELLWIKGNPGCGKSILAAVVLRDLEELRDSQTSVSHFYCDKLNAVKKEAPILFSTLLKEFTLQSDSLPADLEKLYDKKGLLHSKGPGLDDMQTVFPAIVSEFGKAYILVDALDECAGHKKVLLLLNDLLEKCKTVVKVIVFSRPEYVAIKSALKDHAQLFVDRGINPGDPGENAGDIELFIAEKLSDDEYAWNDDPDLLTEVKEEMLKKAEGMFLYVDLVIERLQGPLTPNEVRAKLGALPDGLAESYTAALERIRASNQRDLALKILIWVAYAERPLSRGELLEALSVKSGITSLNKSDRRTNDRGFITLCADLVMCGEDGFYHLNHSSFKDFLQSRPTSISADFQDSSLRNIEPDAFLAEICLTYLLLDDHSFRPAKIKNEYEKIIYDHPLLKYCACYWGVHVGKVQKDPAYEIVWKFLDSEPSRDLSLQVILDVEDVKKKEDLFPMPGLSNPLHLITHFGLTKIAELRPAMRSLTYQADGFGLMPLDYALLNHQRQMCVWLLSCESDISINDAIKMRPAGQNSALRIATENEWEDVFELLLSMKYPVDMQSGPSMATPLAVAASEDLLEFANRLIAAGADVNAKNTDGLTPLMLALRKYSNSVVQPLIEASADVNARDVDGWTPLHFAAYHGNLELVNMLLKNGAISTKCADTFDGNTPVHLAAECGHANVISIFHEHDADVDVQNADGLSPLLVAVLYNALSAAQLLIKLGANRNTITKIGSTILHIAVEANDAETIQFVLDLKPDIDAQAGDGDTALYRVAEAGKTELCALLLKNGASVDITEHKGRTALYIATCYGNEEIVELLLNAGANANVETLAGLRPLIQAAFGGHHTLILPLISKGADPGFENENKSTALHFAAMSGRAEFVREMFAVVPDLDPNPKRVDHTTPLHSAASGGYAPVVQVLLENNATSSFDSFNNLPIHIAASHGYYEIVKLLLSDHNINIQGFRSRTLLQIAAMNGHEDIALLVLDNGADLEVPDEDGSTPIMSTVVNNHEELFDLLLSRGAVVGGSDNLGRSMSHKAAAVNNRALMKKIMHLGCDMTAADIFGYTPFMIAVAEGNVEIINFLLECQIDDSHCQDYFGKTCLHLAAESGNNELIQKLLGLKSNLAGRDSLHRTALGQAAANGHADSVQLLTKLGLDVNGAENCWTTPLYDAVGGGFVETTQYLLQEKVKVDQCIRRSRMTPLLRAAASGYPGITRLLLNHGADPLLRDMFGKNTLDYAAQNPKVLQAIGALGTSHVPPKWAVTKSVLETTVRACILEILALSVTSQPSDEVSMFQNVDILATGLLYLDDDPNRELAELVFIQLTHLPENCPFIWSPACRMCYKSLTKESISICCTCFEVYLCEECSPLYQEGGLTPRSAPEGFQNLEGLEQDIRIVMHAVLEISKEYAFDPRPLAHIIETFSITENWILEQLKAHKDWASKYNEFSSYDHFKPCGLAFLEIITEAIELSRNLEERIWMLGDEFSSNRLSLQERLRKFYSENHILKERAEFVCSGHDYLEITDQKQQKIRKDTSIFAANGRITNEWFEKLLERFPEVANTSGDDASLNIKENIENESIQENSSLSIAPTSSDHAHVKENALDESAQAGTKPSDLGRLTTEDNYELEDFQQIFRANRKFTSPSLSDWGGSSNFTLKRATTAPILPPGEKASPKFVATFSAEETIGKQRLQSLALADIIQPGYRRAYLLESLKNSKLERLDLQVEFDILEGPISEDILRPQYILDDRSDTGQNMGRSLE